METWQLALIVALAAPILGLVGTIIANRFAKPKSDADTRKTNAEATQTLTTTAMTLINELQEQISELRKQAEATENKAELAKSKAEAMLQRIEELETQVKALSEMCAEQARGIVILQHQIEGLGHEPAYKPRANASW